MVQQRRVPRACPLHDVMMMMMAYMKSITQRTNNCTSISLEHEVKITHIMCTHRHRWRKISENGFRTCVSVRVCEWEAQQTQPHLATAQPTAHRQPGYWLCALIKQFSHYIGHSAHRCKTREPAPHRNSYRVCLCCEVTAFEVRDGGGVVLFRSQVLFVSNGDGGCT